MSFLSFSFGSLVFAFWVSVLAERHSKRGAVGGDALIGAILLVVSVVIWVLPSMMKSSKNAIIREYIILLSDINNYVRGAIANPSIVLNGNARSSRIWGMFCLVFIISAVPAGIVWGCVGSGPDVGVVVGVFVGLVACFTAGCATQMVVDCVRRVPMARAQGTFFLLMICLPPALFVGFIAIHVAIKQGWHGTVGIAVISAVLLTACFWWFIPVFIYIVFGVGVPVLQGMTSYWFFKKGEELVRRYNGKFFDKIQVDEVKCDIVDTIMPRGSILHYGRFEDDRRWMKAWSRRAVMMVPEAGKPRKPGPHAVDLRSYIAETFDIFLPGTGAPVLPSRVWSSNGAIDEWHVDSLY